MILSQRFSRAEEPHAPERRVNALSAFPSPPSSDSLSSSSKKAEHVPLWTKEEDRLLAELVGKCLSNWEEIALFFPTKHASIVKRRWENTLDPDIKKTGWTAEEDEVIQTMLAQKGPMWKEIAKALPGRPPDMVKNRYYGHIKRIRDMREKKRREAVAKEAAVKAALKPVEDWETLLAEPNSSTFCSQTQPAENQKHSETELSGVVISQLRLNKPRRIFL
jgi:hypothetical protein